MPKRLYDVVTIGSATQDVFLVSDEIELVKSKRFRTGVAECVSLGSKIEVDKLFISSGGGATNAAATFASLGFRTACLAKVGEDLTAQSIQSDLERFGIDASCLVRAKGQSGYSVLLTTKSGERTALVYRGVSGTLKESNLDWSLFERTRWVYLTSLGGNVNLAKKIVAACKKTKTHLAWNPGMEEIKKGQAEILELLEKDIDVFNVNREEAAALTRVSQESILKLFTELHSGKNRVRIITDGERGSYVCNGASCYRAGTSGKKSVSRTGAGDAFGSGVVASLLQGDPIHTALRVGTLNAESVIGSLGAKEGILKKFPSASALATMPFRPV